MSYTYRGLREFSQFDIGATWESVDRGYWNPYTRYYECFKNDHHITIKPDLVGYQDCRIHVVYRDGSNEVWIECLPEPGDYHLAWRLIARSGVIRQEMAKGWGGYTTAAHPDLRWLWGTFDCLPKAILVLVAAAVIKCRGYQGKGMFLHEINPACIREDWMYPYMSIPNGVVDDETEEKIHDCFYQYRRA